MLPVNALCQLLPVWELRRQPAGVRLSVSGGGEEVGPRQFSEP